MTQKSKATTASKSKKVQIAGELLLRLYPPTAQLSARPAGFIGQKAENSNWQELSLQCVLSRHT